MWLIFTDLVTSVAPNSWFYIGMTNSVGGVWRNIDDGQDATFFRWQNGPSWTPVYPLCAVFYSNGSWVGADCVANRYFICGFSRATSSGTG